jgi:RsiW-degrading membrane proteinase PrsW (M82 family)
MGLFLTLCAGVLLLLSALFSIFGLTTLSGLKTRDPLGIFILAGGILAMGILLIPGIYFNARKFLNQANWNPGLPGLNDRILIPAMVVGWVLSLVFGQLISANQLAAAIILPFLNILALGLPILVYLRISLRGLEMPDARRSWSIFGASLIISPIFSLIFEAIAAGVILLLYLLYASTIPGLKEVFSTLYQSLQTGGLSENDSMLLAAKALFAPGAALATLTIFSIATPLIEETFKVTLIMVYIKKIPRPVDGFVLGILCGAAFALSENIGYASTGSANWAANAAARATTALPHIINSGILGWGLVSAYQEHRFGRLAGAFLAAVLIHGAWNAITLGLVLTGLASVISDVPFYLKNVYPWITGWIILAIGVLIGLAFFNRQMKNSTIKPVPEIDLPKEMESM